MPHVCWNSPSYLLLIALVSWSSCVQSQILSNLLSGLSGGVLQPGTPAVYTNAPSNVLSSTTNWLLGASGLSYGAPASAAAGSGPGTTAGQQQPLLPGFGWLFPVYTNTLRGNCVVYEVCCSGMLCVHSPLSQALCNLGWLKRCCDIIRNMTLEWCLHWLATSCTVLPSCIQNHPR